MAEQRARAAPVSERSQSVDAVTGPRTPDEHERASLPTGDSLPLTRVIAGFAAFVGIVLFAFAGGALMGRVITDEQFWALSSLGLGLYGGAHVVGVR